MRARQDSGRQARRQQIPRSPLRGRAALSTMPCTMNGVSMKQLWFPFLAIAIFTGACSGQTAKKISAFADKVCACKDAACAETVQAEYLDWWKDNQRARGSEGDRKTVEKAMQRYAECHAKLVGPEPAPTSAPAVPKVDLSPPPSPPDEGASEAEATGTN